jgi:hypothetical protein
MSRTKKAVIKKKRTTLRTSDDKLHHFECEAKSSEEQIREWREHRVFDEPDRIAGRDNLTDNE